MIDNESVRSRTTKKFFGMKFSGYIEELKKRTGMKNYEIVDGISNKNSITKYVKGKEIPGDDILESFVKLFNENGMNVTVEDFIPPESMYMEDPSYIADLAESKISPFCEEIGLDLGFLNIVRKLSGTDFDQKFPKWSPILWNEQSLDHAYYYRPGIEMWSGSAKMEGEFELFQYETEVVNKEGQKEKRRLLLSKADLRFLQEVQADVMDYIEYLFMKRKKEMIRELDQANVEGELITETFSSPEEFEKARAAAMEKGKKGKSKLVDPITGSLGAKRLNEIDHYYDYRELEKKREK